MQGVVTASACSAGRVGGPLSEPRAAAGCALVNHNVHFRSAKIGVLEGALVGRTTRISEMKRNLL